MTTLIPSPRVAATAAALLGPCLAALVVPATALAGAGTVSAEENKPLNLTSSSSSTHVSSGGASIVRTIVGLAIVIGVIWGLSWIMRQVKTGRDPQVSSSGLTSVAALTLSSGRSVHLVKAGSEYVLLGSAEHGVVPIHRYSEEEARDAGLLAVEEPVSRRTRTPLLTPSRAGNGHPSGGARHDPMSMSSASAGVVGKLREWTVRR